MRQRGSIGWYLAVVIGVQAVLFSGLTVSAGLGDYRAEVDQAATTSARTARLAADLISESISEVATQMATEASMPGYEAIFESSSDCVLTGGGTGAFGTGEIHLVALDGRVACTSLRPSGGLSGAGYGKQEWLEALERTDPGAPIISGPAVDPLTDRSSLIIAARLSDADGALVTSLDVPSLASGLSLRLGRTSPSPEFAVTTLDRDTLLARSGVADVARIDPAFTQPIGDGRGPVLTDSNGVERIYGAAEVAASSVADLIDQGGDLRWHVWAGVTTREALADAREALQDTFILGIGALIVVLIVGIVIRRRITRPVQDLAAAVDEATDGDLSSRVPVTGPRELARLGERFNRMLEVRAEAEHALTDAYQAERAAAERLRELDTMKNGFLMAISHELRTPLTSVVGYAELLDDPESGLDESERAESIHSLAGQARRLERLLVDLLDVERMSRGTLEPQRRDVDVGDVAMRTLDQLGAQSRVELRIPRGLMAYVDPALLERVIENLVMNAVKHTPRDTEIAVDAERLDGGLVLMVDDTGPGVPDRIKEQIFEPFIQGDVPQHAPGTGVGLSLVLQFAKLHGGHAWVEDRPAGGSSFRVFLPTEGSLERDVA